MTFAAPAAASAHAATGECDVCGGPCKQPFRLPPIHARYPFMTPDQIAATHQPEEPAPPPPAPRRGRRLGEDRARRLEEDRARRPSEDR